MWPTEEIIDQWCNEAKERIEQHMEHYYWYLFLEEIRQRMETIFSMHRDLFPPIEIEDTKKKE